jgi:hypothetical protein
MCPFGYSTPCLNSTPSPDILLLIRAWILIGDKTHPQGGGSGCYQSDGEHCLLNLTVQFYHLSNLHCGSALN